MVDKKPAGFEQKRADPDVICQEWLTDSPHGK